MADMTDTHRMLQWKLAGILERHVERIFKPGTKLTIIARTPGNDEADVLVTSDSLAELAKLVQRSIQRPAVAGCESDGEITGENPRKKPLKSTA